MNVVSSRLRRLKNGLLRHKLKNKNCEPVHKSEEGALPGKSIRGKNDGVPLIEVLHLQSPCMPLSHMTNHLPHLLDKLSMKPLQFLLETYNRSREGGTVAKGELGWVATGGGKAEAMPSGAGEADPPIVGVNSPASRDNVQGRI